MRRLLRVLAVLLFLILLLIGWFWWARPQRVDMAAYAPADCLVYIEANSLLDLSNAIAGTDAWQKLAPMEGLTLSSSHDSWTVLLTRITGIGSTPAVVATRAQAAFVMLDLEARGQGDALEFTSEAALIVETHTSQRRVQPALEKILNDFATKAYGQPRLEKAMVGNYQILRWLKPDSQRRIVANVDGSVVVIGNSDKAVISCLAVRHGQRPSLFHQPELEQMRARLDGNNALTFGYVSGGGATKLISTAAPVVFGRLSEREEFQKFLTSGATKLLGSIGWSAHAAKGGIEDNYFIGVKPELLARVRPAFNPTQITFKGGWEVLPPDVFSVTSYSVRDPAAAWEAMNLGISSQLDVVSAVVYTTAFRALLTPYGIDEPETFLKAVKPDLLTARLDSQSERTLIVAGVANPDELRKFIAHRLGANGREEKIGEAELVTSADEELAAAFAGDYFLLGAPDDVRRCLEARVRRALLVSDSKKLDTLSHYFENPSTAVIVTYAKDSDRTHELLSGLAAVTSKQLKATPETYNAIDSLPYAVTESSLGDSGIERRTRSPFGQFGFLMSLLAPQTAQASVAAPAR